MTIELVVIASYHRPALILPYLERVPHRVHWTTDYDLPPDWKINPAYDSWLRHEKQYVGHLRCWKGHQDALAASQADAALVLEDDAVPNCEDWNLVVAAASTKLTDYEVVSVHGRAFHPDAFEHELLPIHPLKTPLNFYRPKPGARVWVQGTLAYFIRRDAMPKLINKEFDGYPIDIFLCNEFKFGLVDPTPFNHDRSFGSLID